MLSNSARLGACFDGLSEADLVFLRQQGVLADVSQVEPNEVFFVSFNTFLRHRRPPHASAVEQRTHRAAANNCRARPCFRRRGSSRSSAVPIDDGNPPVTSECLAGDPGTERGLAALEFGDVDEATHPLHGLRIGARDVHRQDFGDGVIALDVRPQNRIKDLVVGERLIVALVGFEFGRWRLGEHSGRDDRSTGNLIAPAHKS